MGRKKVNIPDTFLSNGKVLSVALEISEGFNNFFTNIGSDLAKITIFRLFVIGNRKKLCFRKYDPDP